MDQNPGSSTTVSALRSVQSMVRKKKGDDEHNLPHAEIKWEISFSSSILHK